MGKARFSYVPNIPTPGEAELAASTANNPVAGIYLLNAQMERRRGLEEHNATMEQIMEAQNAQAAIEGKNELMKAILSASNPYAQAPAALQAFPGAGDEIAKQQQLEFARDQAENFQKIAAGQHSALQAGIATGPDPLASVGLPGNFTNVTPLEIQKEQMQGETSRDVARIGANATLGAARERGSDGTKPKVTFSYVDPLSQGTYGFQGGDLATVQNEAAALLQGSTPNQVSSLPEEEIQRVMPSLQTIANNRGEQLKSGARPRRITRGGQSMIAIQTVGPDGSPSEVAVYDRANP